MAQHTNTCIYNCGTNTEQIQFFREKRKIFVDFSVGKYWSKVSVTKRHYQYLVDVQVPSLAPIKKPPNRVVFFIGMNTAGT